MKKETPIARLRRQALHDGRKVKARGAKVVPIDEAPSDFHKTSLMRLLEVHHGKPIEDLLKGGTVREIGKRLGIHYSLVTKWRQQINKQKEK
jgi:hypothetical protein